MLAALFITLREGLEAALILAVILSFLYRGGERARARTVWAGVAAALALSLGAGSILYLVSEELSEEAAEVFEIAVTVLAVAVLTYVIVWMRGKAAGIRGQLENRTGKALASSSPLALGLLAFSAVGREGLETVVFLFASAGTAGVGATAAGGTAGLLLAALAGVALFRGSRRFPLGLFFRVTGALLIFLAAGILSHALGELYELGLPAALVEPLWDTGGWLPDDRGAGAMLRAVAGYDESPGVVQLAGSWLYLALMSWLYFRPRSGGRLRAAGQEA